MGYYSGSAALQEAISILLLTVFIVFLILLCQRGQIGALLRAFGEKLQAILQPNHLTPEPEPTIRREKKNDSDDSDEDGIDPPPPKPPSRPGGSHDDDQIDPPPHPKPPSTPGRSPPRKEGKEPETRGEELRHGQRDPRRDGETSKNRAENGIDSRFAADQDPDPGLRRRRGARGENLEPVRDPLDRNLRNPIDSKGEARISSPRAERSGVRDEEVNRLRTDARGENVRSDEQEGARVRRQRAEREPVDTRRGARELSEDLHSDREVRATSGRERNGVEEDLPQEEYQRAEVERVRAKANRGEPLTSEERLVQEEYIRRANRPRPPPIEVESPRLSHREVSPTTNRNAIRRRPRDHLVGDRSRARQSVMQMRHKRGKNPLRSAPLVGATGHESQEELSAPETRWRERDLEWEDESTPVTRRRAERRQVSNEAESQPDNRAQRAENRTVDPPLSAPVNRSQQSQDLDYLSDGHGRNRRPLEQRRRRARPAPDEVASNGGEETENDDEDEQNRLGHRRRGEKIVRPPTPGNVSGDEQEQVEGHEDEDVYQETEGGEERARHRKLRTDDPLASLVHPDDLIEENMLEQHRTDEAQSRTRQSETNDEDAPGQSVDEDGTPKRGRRAKSKKSRKVRFEEDGDADEEDVSEAEEVLDEKHGKRGKGGKKVDGEIKAQKKKKGKTEDGEQPQEEGEVEDIKVKPKKPAKAAADDGGKPGKTEDAPSGSGKTGSDPQTIKLDITTDGKKVDGKGTDGGETAKSKSKDEKNGKGKKKKDGGGGGDDDDEDDADADVSDSTKTKSKSKSKTAPKKKDGTSADGPKTKKKAAKDEVTDSEGDGGDPQGTKKKPKKVDKNVAQGDDQQSNTTTKKKKKKQLNDDDDDDEDEDDGGQSKSKGRSGGQKDKKSKGPGNGKVRNGGGQGNNNGNDDDYDNDYDNGNRNGNGGSGGKGGKQGKKGGGQFNQYDDTPARVQQQQQQQQQAVPGQIFTNTPGFIPAQTMAPNGQMYTQAPVQQGNTIVPGNPSGTTQTSVPSSQSNGQTDGQPSVGSTAFNKLKNLGHKDKKDAQGTTPSDQSQSGDTPDDGDKNNELGKGGKIPVLPDGLESGDGPEDKTVDKTKKLDGTGMDASNVDEDSQDPNDMTEEGKGRFGWSLGHRKSEGRPTRAEMEEAQNMGQPPQDTAPKDLLAPPGDIFDMLEQADADDVTDIPNGPKFDWEDTEDVEDDEDETSLADPKEPLEIPSKEDNGDGGIETGGDGKRVEEEKVIEEDKKPEDGLKPSQGGMDSPSYPKGENELLGDLDQHLQGQKTSSEPAKVDPGKHEEAEVDPAKEEKTAGPETTSIKSPRTTRGDAGDESDEGERVTSGIQPDHTTSVPTTSLDTTKHEARTDGALQGGGLSEDLDGEESTTLLPDSAKDKLKQFTASSDDSTLVQEHQKANPTTNTSSDDRDVRVASPTEAEIKHPANSTPPSDDEDGDLLDRYYSTPTRLDETTTNPKQPDLKELDVEGHSQRDEKSGEPSLVSPPSDRDDFDRSEVAGTPSPLTPTYTTAAQIVGRGKEKEERMGHQGVQDEDDDDSEDDRVGGTETKTLPLQQDKFTGRQEDERDSFEAEDDAIRPVGRKEADSHQAQDDQEFSPIGLAAMGVKEDSDVEEESIPSFGDKASTSAVDSGKNVERKDISTPVVGKIVTEDQDEESEMDDEPTSRMTQQQRQEAQKTGHISEAAGIDSSEDTDPKIEASSLSPPKKDEDRTTADPTRVGHTELVDDADSEEESDPVTPVAATVPSVKETPQQVDRSVDDATTKRPVSVEDEDSEEEVEPAHDPITRSTPAETLSDEKVAPIPDTPVESQVNREARKGDSEVLEESADDEVVQDPNLNEKVDTTAQDIETGGIQKTKVEKQRDALVQQESSEDEDSADEGVTGRASDSEPDSPVRPANKSEEEMQRKLTKYMTQKTLQSPTEKTPAQLEEIKRHGIGTLQLTPYQLSNREFIAKCLEVEDRSLNWVKDEGSKVPSFSRTGLSAEDVRRAPENLAPTRNAQQNFGLNMEHQAKTRPPRKEKPSESKKRTKNEDQVEEGGISSDKKIRQATILHPWTLTKYTAHILRHTPFMSSLTLLCTLGYIGGTYFWYTVVLASLKSSPVLSSRAQDDTTASTNPNGVTQELLKMGVNSDIALAVLNIYMFIGLCLLGLLIHLTIERVENPSDRNEEPWYKHPLRPFRKFGKSSRSFLTFTINILLTHSKISTIKEIWYKSTWFTSLRICIFTIQIGLLIICNNQAISLTYMVITKSPQPPYHTWDLEYSASTLGLAAESFDPNMILFMISTWLIFFISTLTWGWYSLLHPSPRHSKGEKKVSLLSVMKCGCIPSWTIETIGVILVLVAFGSFIAFFTEIISISSKFDPTKQDGGKQDQQMSWVFANGVFLLFTLMMTWVVFELDKFARWVIPKMKRTENGKNGSW
ncbi:hypothetical protein TREMEDRAFT_63833 [Tremella mesenterica DSM 1558]|uniref:uncharacterized protein n=1 Tax=Tremella mesenterica (strain ATCC 24925 / CBS 8224 / DSM 1558 / NBRC 9311 / NRRL Y-6157 / RJB 2259-6 / UBC 559-6) TaxID=578456 RepID=UPI0003F4A2B6|nr:uncharacterized protein TREMEDRAFT_63833 [Tremella mesenterica DSM 1558]EIW67948.1 hypothetical protein TREMEDRAFT_63833 [Tremella mesenterica DSM 1558]